MSKPYAAANLLSSVISLSPDVIPLSDFDNLPPVPKKPSKSKRKPARKKNNSLTDFQKYLAELVDASGMKKKEIDKRSKARGWRVPVTTLNAVLRTAVNPGVKTIESVALALDQEPIAVLARALDTPPKGLDEEFLNSPIALLWNLFRKLSPEDQEQFARYAIKPAIEYMQERTTEGK